MKPVALIALLCATSALPQAPARKRPSKKKASYHALAASSTSSTETADQPGCTKDHWREQAKKALGASGKAFEVINLMDSTSTPVRWFRASLTPTTITPSMNNEPREMDGDETLIYEMDVLIWFSKHQADEDFHISVVDDTPHNRKILKEAIAAGQSHTDVKDDLESMIVESVDPTCPDATSSNWAESFTKVRDALNSLLAQQPGGGKDLVLIPAHIKGFGFFDVEHLKAIQNQSKSAPVGASPNAFELHPLIELVPR